jgi:tetrahydromethanopterin S-methyltransferase subunit G
MSEENILDFLRARFNRIDARLDDHSRKFDDVITRLGALERGQADLRRDIAEVHVGLAAVNTRLDNLDRRVTRIERRLDLIEDPAATEP